MTAKGSVLTWTDGVDARVRAACTGPGAPFELAVEEVLGARMEVFVNQPLHLRQALASAAERFGDRDYLVFEDRTYTFAQARDAAASVAEALRQRYGVGPGDRVAIVAANCAGFAITVWATVSLGAIAVALNGWWTTPELHHGLDLSEPKVLLGDRRRLERLDGSPPSMPVVVFEDEWDELEGAFPGASLPDMPVDRDDPAILQFTSGTTGRAKAAAVSHRAIFHFLQASTLGAVAHGVRTAGDGPPPAPPEGQPRVLGTSPLFHVSGLNAQLVSAALIGMAIIYHPPGRWQEETHLRLSEQYRVTNWSLVPTQLWRLVHWPELDRYDLSSLRTIGGGSAVWSPELIRLVGERLPAANASMGLGYGMTETSGLGTIMRGHEVREHSDSVGSASPTVSVAVRHADTGEVVPEGEVGEICLQSGAGFLGYWGNEEATAASFYPDRWYRTGDLGRVEDGRLYLAGRRSDLIIRGGENVYPAEVENRLLEHPDVDEVAVVGVDDPALGQQVKAIVVLRAGALSDGEALRRWAGGGLASFKVPSLVEFRAELPHNATGKVARHLLDQPEGAGHDPAEAEDEQGAAVLSAGPAGGAADGG